MIVWRDKSVNTGTPWVTLGIIAANCLVFFIFNLARHGEGIDDYGVNPASFNVATLLTAPFMHGGFLHLLGNMYFLWVFGREVEEGIGRGMYLGFYFLFGIIAGMADLAARAGSNVSAIGASGAISGVMAMFCVIYPSKRFGFFSFTQGVKNISAVGLIAFFLALDLLGAIGSDDGVAHFAHLGGTLCGAFVGLIFRLAEVVTVVPEAQAALAPTQAAGGLAARVAPTKSLADLKPEQMMKIAKDIQAKRDLEQKGLTRKFLILMGTLGVLMFFDAGATIVAGLAFLFLGPLILLRLAFVWLFPMLDSPLDFVMKWASKLFWAWYGFFWILWFIMHAAGRSSEN
jgi:membrane associated rhomboid family serine protease